MCCPVPPLLHSRRISVSVKLMEKVTEVPKMKKIMTSRRISQQMLSRSQPNEFHCSIKFSIKTDVNSFDQVYGGKYKMKLKFSKTFDSFWHFQNFINQKCFALIYSSARDLFSKQYQTTPVIILSRSSDLK